jgi:alanine-synthesizing transaminase
LPLVLLPADVVIRYIRIGVYTGFTQYGSRLHFSLIKMFSSRTDWKLAPNRFTKMQRELQASGATLLDLTASNPTRVGIHYDGEAILSALVAPESLDYDPQPRGLPQARQAIVDYYREEHDAYNVDPEHIILTTSTSEAYSYLFRLLCNPDDELLVPKPSYPLFDFLAELQDVKLVPYPLIYDHGWQIDFPSLYKAVKHRTRGVVLVHPNNPTGSYVRNEEVATLNNFCREYNLALIVDEVFLDYSVDGAPRSSFVSNRDTLTFSLSGLSKISGLPQMKVSWLAVTGPNDDVEHAMARLEVIADTYLSMNAPIQRAVPLLLEQRKNIQPVLLDRLRASLEELDRQLARHSSVKRLDLDGGWYAVLRVPVTQSDEDLAIEIMQKCAVLVHPGHFYDFPQDGYLIVSLITPAGEFREGIRRMLELL